MAEPMPAPIEREWPAAIRALRHRNFRFFWFGQMVSLVGTWMQNAAQSWLVLMLATTAYGAAHASFYVGMIGAAGSAPMFLFCLVGGVVSDRTDRRRILLVTQSSLMLLALGLGLLVSTGTVRLWHVAIFSACSGLAMAFDMPTRQAFVKDMASPRDLLNAIALNSIIFNLARIFGPALAGQMIKQQDIHLGHLFGASRLTIPFGIPGALYVNAASFLAVIAGLFLIRYRRAPTPPSDNNLWQHLGEGFRYVLRNQTILLLLLVIATFSIFGFSYAVLMPVVAKHVLHQNAGGYGWLMGAAGLGATIGAALLACTGGRLRKGRVLFWGALICSLGLLGFGMSHTYWLSLVILLFVGGGLVVASACVNSMIQEIVPDQLRGRVVSIWALVFAGFSPLGAIYAGIVANATTPGCSVFLGGVACLVVLSIITLKSRWLWSIR